MANNGLLTDPTESDSREANGSSAPTSPNMTWRMPTAFGPMPGPRQDISGTSRIASLRNSTCESATIVFKTSATMLQSLLPCPEISFIKPDTTALASYKFQALDNMEWLGGTGYELVGFYIHGVQYRKQNGETVAGKVLAIMFENFADPIISGREELGYPKVFSDISIESINDQYIVELSWRGATFGRFKWPALQETPQHVAWKTKEAAEEKILVHKFVPATGSNPERKPDANYVAALDLSQEKIGETILRRREPGASAEFNINALNWKQLPTLHHIIARLAELPIFEIVEAAVLNGIGVPDMTSITRLD